MWGITGYHTLLEGDETLTCIRQGLGVPDDITYVDGLPTVAHKAVQFQITATVQPMGGRDLMLVPEAFRVKDMLSLWQAHRTAKQDVIRLNVSDIILFRGAAYQVQSAEDWQSYTKATLCGIDVGSFAGVVDPKGLPVLYPDTSGVTPDPTPTPDPAPTPNPTPTPKPDPTPTPVPTPTPTSTEELDMDAGPFTLNQFFNPGDTQDFRVPGDGTTSMRYRMPRSGVITGYTITGSANTSQYGAYLTRRDISTSITGDAVFVDPATQPSYRQDAGTQVTFPTPLRCNRGDSVTLKWRIADGNFGQVDVMAFLQITLDPATSS